MNTEKELFDLLEETLYNIAKEGLSDALEKALCNIAKEELYDIVTDLMLHGPYFAFFEGLFSVQAGEWLDLESLCDSYEDITKQFKKLRKLNALKAPVNVTWLAYSHSSYGEGFCLIVFYCQAPLWDKNMIYNKNYIIEKMAKAESKPCE